MPAVAAANIILFIQLCWFGSDKPFSPRRTRPIKDQHIINARKGWVASFWTDLEHFNLMAVIKLCLFIEVAMVAGWALSVILPLRSDPDWDLEVPHDFNLPVFAMGWAGVMCFFFARLYQLVMGWWGYFHDHVPDKPSVNIIFILLYGENLLQLVALLLMSWVSRDPLRHSTKLPR